MAYTGITGTTPRKFAPSNSTHIDNVSVEDEESIHSCLLEEEYKEIEIIENNKQLCHILKTNRSYDEIPTELESKCTENIIEDVFGGLDKMLNFVISNANEKQLKGLITN